MILETEYNFEYDDIKKAMEYSLNETINGLKDKLPAEPIENSLALSIHFIDNSTGCLFSRKFNYSDKINVISFIFIYLIIKYQDLINFCKVKLRTLNEILLINFNNNKVYNEKEKTLNDAKINDNDTLSVEILHS